MPQPIQMYDPTLFVGPWPMPGPYLTTLPPQSVWNEHATEINPQSACNMPIPFGAEADRHWMPTNCQCLPQGVRRWKVLCRFSQI